MDTESCHNQKRLSQGFYLEWIDYQCYCSSELATSEVMSDSAEIYNTNTVTSSITPVTPFMNERSSQLSQSRRALAALVVVLAMLLVLVISGWVWTCWMVKKLREQIKSSQTNK